MPNPGGYTLNLDSHHHSTMFSRALIDGGSSSNILDRDTMTKLGLKAKDLQPTRMIFHNIVPGLSCSPIGWIWLEILFGGKEHFRREPIWFEVVDQSSLYHALLGRLVLTKFMAVPHYAYLKMKLPGPTGLITVAGDYCKSLECAQAGVKLAESMVIEEERHQLHRIIVLANEILAVPALAKEPAGEALF